MFDSLQIQEPSRYTQCLIPQASLLDNIPFSAPITSYKPSAALSSPAPVPMGQLDMAVWWHSKQRETSPASKNTLGYHTQLYPDPAQHHAVTQDSAQGGSHLPSKRKTRRIGPQSMGLFSSQISVHGYSPFMGSCSGRKQTKVLAAVKNLVLLLQEGWCKSSHRAQAT